MNVVSRIDELRKIRHSQKGSVGLVPTMGFLHDGHLSLVREAREENSFVVVSIFVNPTQFGPSEDLSSYPRDLDRDLLLLAEEGVDLVWNPTPEIMYPSSYQTWVQVENLTKTLEGAQRPGHFRGVTTIVAKLFNAVSPDRAYFGQKDAQQAVVIRRMVKDLNFPIEIILCPIVREPDGLALSSRNTYLNNAQRKAAPILYKALTEAKRVYQDRELRDADQLTNLVLSIIQTEPLAEVQYVSISDLETLEELHGDFAAGLLSLAVYFGRTRLIDNILLADEERENHVINH